MDFVKLKMDPNRISLKSLIKIGRMLRIGILSIKQEHDREVVFDVFSRLNTIRKITLALLAQIEISVELHNHISIFFKKFQKQYLLILISFSKIIC